VDEAGQGRDQNQDDDREEAIEVREDPVVCATCGSPDIIRTSRGLMFAGAAVTTVGVGIAVGLTDAAFLAVLAFAVYFLISGRWRCSECGETWD
jgi:ribosomal protein L37AE/L43A